MYRGIMSRGGGSLKPPLSGKAVFMAVTDFFVQKPAAKNGKIIFIKQKKCVLSCEMKRPKSGFSVII